MKMTANICVDTLQGMNSTSIKRVLEYTFLIVSTLLRNCFLTAVTGSESTETVSLEITPVFKILVGQYWINITGS